MHPLKERLADYLGFLDRVAFTDNPDWAGCYCLVRRQLRRGSAAP